VVGTPSYKITKTAIFIAFGSVLYVVESFLPGLAVLPGGKWGISNVILVIGIETFDLKMLLIIAISKSILGSLLGGTFLSIPFLLGISGACMSAVAMFSIYRIRFLNISLIGISILGAWISNLTQLLIVAILIVNSFNIIYYLPVITFMSILTGGVNGIVANYIKKLNHLF